MQPNTRKVGAGGSPWVLRAAWSTWQVTKQWKVLSRPGRKMGWGMSVSSQCPWEIQTKGLKERPWTWEKVHLREHCCQVLPRMWWWQRGKIARKTWQFATELNLLTTQRPCSLVYIPCIYTLWWYTHRRTWKLTFTLIWTRTIIAALTIMAQTQKLPRCPMVGKWADAADGDNGIVFSAEKCLWSHEKTWRNLTCTRPSEKSRWKGCRLCHLNPSVLRKRKNYEDSAKISCCQGLGQDRMTRDHNRLLRLFHVTL